MNVKCPECQSYKTGCQGDYYIRCAVIYTLIAIFFFWTVIAPIIFVPLAAIDFIRGAAYSSYAKQCKNCGFKWQKKIS